MIDANTCHTIYQIGGLLAGVFGFCLGMVVVAIIISRNPSR